MMRKEEGGRREAAAAEFGYQDAVLDAVLFHKKHTLCLDQICLLLT
ncbi:MAG: hypothetical protein GY707_19535 [Desulfobacteraceae bacterium]|nr:hypothetical protein [Desulfobacteraceae bacterium]